MTTTLTETPSPKEVRVVATKMGYYAHKRRRQGDVFMLVQGPGEPLPSWVELEATYVKRRASEAESELDDTDRDDAVDDDEAI